MPYGVKFLTIVLANEDTKEDSQNGMAADEDESDDEAPSDVPFSQAKDEALSLQNMEKAMRMKIQEAIKSRNRKRDALQKEQKARKLEILSSKKLPEDILDQVSSTSKPLLEKQKVKLNTKKKFTSLKGIEIHYNFNLTFLMVLHSVESQKPLFSTLPAEGSTTFQVAVLESKRWKKRFMLPPASGAASFREQALSKGVKRQSSKSYYTAA